MKISELITKLAAIKEQHGDLSVMWPEYQTDEVKQLSARLGMYSPPHTKLDSVAVKTITLGDPGTQGETFVVLS